jgi:hypothetical protein
VQPVRLVLVQHGAKVLACPVLVLASTVIST